MLSFSGSECTCEEGECFVVGPIVETLLRLLPSGEAVPADLDPLRVMLFRMEVRVVLEGFQRSANKVGDIFEEGINHDLCQNLEGDVGVVEAASVSRFCEQLGKTKLNFEVRDVALCMQDGNGYDGIRKKLK